MLIIPIRSPYGGITLNAFSYSNQELDSVRVVLDRLKIPFRQESITPDKEGRKGISHIINENNSRELAKKLGVEFEGEGKTTRVTIKEGEYNYRCEEISKNRNGGCENIYAQNDSEATVKCALVASKNSWFGSVANPGLCSGSGSKNFLSKRCYS